MCMAEVQTYRGTLLTVGDLYRCGWNVTRWEAILLGKDTKLPEQLNQLSVLGLVLIFMEHLLYLHVRMSSFILRAAFLHTQ